MNGFLLPSRHWRRSDSVPAAIGITIPKIPEADKTSPTTVSEGVSSIRKRGSVAPRKPQKVWTAKSPMEKKTRRMRGSR